jgi:hypothetical protein
MIFFLKVSEISKSKFQNQKKFEFEFEFEFLKLKIILKITKKIFFKSQILNYFAIVSQFFCN